MHSSGSTFLIVLLFSLVFSGVDSLLVGQYQTLDKPKLEISDEALEIHHSGLLFDGHNDLPWAIRTSAGSSFDNVDITKATKFHKTESSAAPEVGKKLFELTVNAGDIDRTNAIVTTFVDTEDFTGDTITLSDSDGNTMFGQISAPSIRDIDAAQGKRELTFVLPTLEKGATLELVATDAGLNSHLEFAWHDDESTSAELRFGSQAVMSYQYESLDTSSDKRRQETYKVYHHVYTPAGDRLLTKGPGGLYPHHRGLFYGFNVIVYGRDKTVDNWHCKNGATQTHEKSVSQQAGPVFGRDVNLIFWRGTDGQPFATELRELRAIKLNGGTMIDFASTLATLDGPIRLEGDPQHAGFQFRASQDVPDKTKQLTFYIRPDGKGKPGEFRNWSDKTGETEVNKAHVNLPWNAICLALPYEAEVDGETIIQERRFTVCYFDHPDNPKPARYSERDYGRFGSYFEYDLTEENPLSIRYRIWVQDGELDVPQIQAISDSFTNPVTVTIDE